MIDRKRLSCAGIVVGVLIIAVGCAQSLLPVSDFALSGTDAGQCAIGACITFDGAYSRPSGDTQIVQYDWAFGDGVQASGLSLIHI